MFRILEFPCMCLNIFTTNCKLFFSATAKVTIILHNGTMVTDDTVIIIPPSDTITAEVGIPLWNNVNYLIEALPPIIEGHRCHSAAILFRGPYGDTTTTNTNTTNPNTTNPNTTNPNTTNPNITNPTTTIPNTTNPDINNTNMPNATITVETIQPSTIYVAVNSNSDGGLSSTFPSEGWYRIEGKVAFKWISGTEYLDTIWKVTVFTPQAVSFNTSKEGLIHALFVKTHSKDLYFFLKQNK